MGLMIARLIGLLALAAVLLCTGPTVAAAAVAPNVKRVLADYRNDGRIDPCRHSAKDLRDTLKAVSADTEQYAPDFPAAVEAALEARARGECDKTRKLPGAPGNDEDSTGAGAGAGTPPAAPPPVQPSTSNPSTTAPPALPDATPEAAPIAAPTPSGAGITQGVPAPADNRPDVVLTRPAAKPVATETPVPLIVIAALLGACLVAGLVALAIQRFGWGEERLAGVRHAWGEAGYRTGGTWQDFTDWVRFGR